jgi:hypothetical protein
MEIDQEAAVAQFLKLARSCQERNLTAAEVVREFTTFYRDIRIAGAAVNEDADMLLFQWGAGQHLLLTEPRDLRESDDGELQFDPADLLFLDFTRQVFTGDDEDDFDDLAIQMGLTLVYGPANPKTESGNLWIRPPKRIDWDLKKHAAQPLVAELLNAAPTRYVATVGNCG